MSFLASDTEIGDDHFDGETVPGANTISSSRNTRIKTKCQNKILAKLHLSSMPDDPSGEPLKEMFLELYGRELDPDIPFLIMQDEMWHLRDALGKTSLKIQSKGEDITGNSP